MLLQPRSIRHHQSFKQVFSDSLLRGRGNVERMTIAGREQFKALFRSSNEQLQLIEEHRLVRCGSFAACNWLVRSQRANCG